MKITATHFDIKITIEIKEDSNLPELINAYKAITIAFGFSIDSWQKFIL